MQPSKEVTIARLYTKSPGSKRLRKGAEAELRSLLAAGWHEIQRTDGPDFVKVRLERPIVRMAMDHPPARADNAPAARPQAPRPGGRPPRNG